MNWREALVHSFDQVTAAGGLYALEFEYCFERRGRSRERQYRILWSNRLAAVSTKKGATVQFECGTIRTGREADSVAAVAEVLDYLARLRENKSPSRIAA